MIKIAIADDHQLFRKSLILLINSFEGMQVVADAESGAALLQELDKFPVDVLLLDIQMPGMDGFETCKAVKENFPDIRVLMVSQLTTKESIRKVMELGAEGFFTKNADPPQLESAIRGLHENGYYFDMELGKIIREAMLWKQKLPGTVSLSGVKLTQREVEIIQMACAEMSSGEIAEKLHLNIRTIDSHRKRIMEKTNSKNFIGAVLFALKNNYIDLTSI